MASRPASTSVSLAAAEMETAVASSSGEPGVAVTVAQPIPLDLQRLGNRRQASSELDQILVALAPAVEYLEFPDDALLRFGDIVGDNRGVLIDQGALQSAEARDPHALPATSIV